MGKKRCRCLCFHDCCLIFLSAYRAHKGLLHVMYPFYFCRSDTQFFTDKLISQMFHRGTTVRTDPFFRRNFTGDLFYGKSLIQVCTDRFFPLVRVCSFTTVTFSSAGISSPVSEDLTFSLDVPTIFLFSSSRVSFRFAMVLRRSFMVALRSAMVCSCSLFVFSKIHHNFLYEPKTPVLILKVSFYRYLIQSNLTSSNSCLYLAVLVFLLHYVKSP